MNDLISRKAILSSFQQYCDRNCPYPEQQRDVMCKACSMGDAIAIVENADGKQEQKKGKWIDCDRGNIFHCSVCADYWIGVGGYRYCPHCGAEMEIENE